MSIRPNYIQPDGSILVKPGDTIGKYCIAIHGRIDTSKFNEYLHVRKVPHRANAAGEAPGPMQPLTNVNLIFTGETLYHKPSMPHGSIGSPPPVGVPPIPPPTNVTGEPTPDSVVQFINWSLRVLNPISEWSVIGSNDFSISTTIISGQACQVGLQKVDKDSPSWFSGASAGPAAKLGATWSSTWLSNSIAPLVGGTTGRSFVAKSPTAGTKLSAAEFAGNFLRADIGAAAGIGVGASVLAVGCKAPPEFIARKAMEMLGGHGQFSWVPIAPMALIVLSGVNVGVDVGFSLKIGYMRDTTGYPFLG